MEQLKSTEYTYEIGQVASILSNPAYTLDKTRDICKGRAAFNTLTDTPTRCATGETKGNGAE